MTHETLDAYTRLFATLGFPTATAALLLWWLVRQLNGKLDRLTDAMHELPDRIADRISDKLEALLK